MSNEKEFSSHSEFMENEILNHPKPEFTQKNISQKCQDWLERISHVKFADLGL